MFNAFFKKSKRLERVILEARREGEAINGDNIRLDFRQEWLESIEEMSDDLLVLRLKSLDWKGICMGSSFPENFSVYRSVKSFLRRTSRNTSGYCRGIWKHSI